MSYMTTHDPSSRPPNTPPQSRVQPQPFPVYPPEGPMTHSLNGPNGPVYHP